jgi:hypothetical protein
MSELEPAGLSLGLGASLNWYEVVGFCGPGCADASELFAGAGASESFAGDGASELFAGLGKLDCPPTSRDMAGAAAAEVGLGASLHLMHPSLVTWVYAEAYVVEMNVFGGSGVGGTLLPATGFPTTEGLGN